MKLPFNCMHIIHVWSFWSTYQETGTQMRVIDGKTIPYFNVRQWRRCIECGIMEDRLVKDGPIDAGMVTKEKE